MIKLTYTTVMLAQHLDFDQSIQLAKDSGCAGVDFRTGEIFKHGVETKLTQEERRAMRRKLEDNYLEVASLNAGHKFDYVDPQQRRQNIEDAKKTCQLAYDLGCSRVRVFGNDIRTEYAQDCTAYVAEAVGEVADFAAPLGVDVMLEMHGQFNYWGYVLDVMQRLDRPNTGILYNCDKRDLVAGSCRETFGRVKKYVRHIHMHDLYSGYPYVELFEELIRMGYDGYLSAEIEESPDPTRVMKLHNIGVKAMLDVARRNVALMG